MKITAQGRISNQSSCYVDKRVHTLKQRELQLCHEVVDVLTHIRVFCFASWRADLLRVFFLLFANPLVGILWKQEPRGTA